MIDPRVAGVGCTDSTDSTVEGTILQPAVRNHFNCYLQAQHVNARECKWHQHVLNRLRTIN